MDDHEQALPRDLAELGEEVRSAYELARQAHAGQRRKGIETPYISHPVAVARLVHEQGLGAAAVAAALLHDVVEDSETTIAQLRSRFSPEVADLVEAMTDDRTLEDYEERKDAHRRHVERAGELAAAIYAADKLVNLKDMRRLYSELGEAAGERFNAPIDLRVDLWRRDLEMVESLVGANGNVAALRDELERFIAERR